MSSNTRKTWKVIVEFPTPEAALEWFDAIKPSLPERADLFEADAMDLGRAAAGDFIARSSDDRPEFQSLRTLVQQRAEAKERAKLPTKIKR